MSNRASLVVHAARGPILLITVGILAALHQSGKASLTHTFPLLIIVLGIVMLIERILAPRIPYGAPGQPYPQPPYAPPPFGQPPPGGPRP